MECYGTIFTSVEAFRTNFLFFIQKIFQNLHWYLSNSFTLVPVSYTHLDWDPIQMTKAIEAVQAGMPKKICRQTVWGASNDPKE